MANGNKEVSDLPLISDPTNGDLYIAKAGADFRARAGGASGIAVLDSGGKLAAGQETANTVLKTGSTSTGTQRIIMNPPALSGTAYSDGHMELQSNNGAGVYPRMGFHRGGDSAAAFVFKGGNSFSLVNNLGTEYAFWTAANFDPATKVTLNAVNTGAITFSGPTASLGLTDRSSGRGWVIYGTSDTMNVFNGSGNVVIIDPSGNVTALNFIATSDESLKESIDRKPSTRDFSKLNLATWVWKNEQTPGIGVIAQDVEKVAPEYVLTNNDGIKGVDKAGLALEIAMQALARVEVLEAIVAKMYNTGPVAQ